MENKVLDFGKFKGVSWTRIPVGYLKWMVNVNHGYAIMANAELKRRGTSTPNLDVSGHAIDRASLYCRKIWHRSRGDNEGINSWLIRMCNEALRDGPPDNDGCIYYFGMKFVFEVNGVWPVLKTIMPIKKDKKVE